MPEGTDWKDMINKNALTVLKNAKLEPMLKDAKVGERFQFVRMGYFCVDSKDSAAGKPIFNRTVTLKDPYTKGKGKDGQAKGKGGQGKGKGGPAKAKKK